MIQRIQTIYLLIAVICMVVCLSMPIGAITVTGSNALNSAIESMTVYNLWLTTPSLEHQLTTWPLFLLLIVSSSLSLFAIGAYKNRLFQSRLCMFASLIIVGWHIVFAVFSKVLPIAEQGQSFELRWPAIFPLIALVLLVMARRAIMADEKLVRAADRIR